MSETALGQRFTALSIRWPAARIFWAFLALHLLIWSLLPALLQHNLPLDVIEQLAWGREWQIVYFKHPPLPAWIVESVAVVSGGWPPALYLVGPLCSALSLFAIWRLGCAMLGPRRALLAVLAQEGVVYFTIFTPEFNHNVVLLPLWAALGLAGYRALFETGSPTRRRSAAGPGSARSPHLACSANTPRCCCCCRCCCWRSCTLGCAASGRAPARGWRWPSRLLLLLPHLLGLWHIGFTPLLFPFQRAPGPTHWYDHIVNPLLFAVAQFGDIAAALLAVALLAWRRPGEPVAVPVRAALPPEQRAYLATITWAPAGLAVAASVLLGLHLKDMWGYPMWCFIGLFLMAELAGPFTSGGLWRFGAVWLAILLAVPAVFAVQHTIGGRFVAKSMRSAFPGPELARAVEQRWHAAVGTRLPIVAGDVWLAGNIAFYGSDRPAVFIDADPAKSPWITPDALARRGAVLIWPASEGRPVWLEGFPSAQEQPPIALPYAPALGHAPARFEWAILPPARSSTP